MSDFPTLAGILLAAGVILGVTGLTGWQLGDWLLPGRREARLLAPALGFALQSAVLLPVCTLLGVSVPVIMGSVIGTLALAHYLARSRLAEAAAPARSLLATAAFIAAAAIVAVLPALPVVPQLDYGGAGVGTQIFDHVKVAIIDEIARSGRLPPGNPFYGGNDPAQPLAYYYLLYLMGAALRTVLGISGWTADIALTWFAAFISLLLMGALACRIAGRASAAWWVLPLALVGTVRLAAYKLGFTTLQSWLAPTHALESWPDQASWSPHHLIGGVLATLAVLAACRLIGERRPSAGGVAVTAALAASAFGCSAWVGGITLAIMMVAVLAVVLWQRRRELPSGPTFGALLLAGALSLALAWPMIASQTSFLSDGMLPVRLDIFPVFARVGSRILGSRLLANLLDVAGFWLVLLPLNLPATYLLGVPAILLKRGPQVAGLRAICGTAAAASLLVGQFLSSALTTNDLGWRAIVPAILLLTPWAAAAIDDAVRNWRAWWQRTVLVAAAAVAALGLPGGYVSTVWGGTGLYLAGKPTADQVSFYTSPLAWRDVQRLTRADERVLNNPSAMARLTPWAGNLGWAFFSDRRSCAAGQFWLWDFAPMQLEELHRHMLLLERFFAGQASPADLQDIFVRLRCRVILVTPADGAWSNDGMARVPGLSLIGERPAAWRIYRWTPP